MAEEEALDADFVIYGPVLVKVKVEGEVKDLGLTDSPIVIAPRYYHQDLRADDYSDRVGPDTMAMLADCIIEMTLVFFDESTLLSCLASSIAALNDGAVAGAGTIMGANKEAGTKGCHYVSLNLVSNTDWRFPASYLAEMPMRYPIGTKRSLVRLRWRAIPYVGTLSPGDKGSVSSKNKVIWDHILDV